MTENLSNLSYKKLTVSIRSFSYGRGIPHDTSGHGGGFVFDCRSIHNPGLYAEYKNLTGKDKPVADFLDKEHQMTEFLDLAEKIVALSIKSYLKKGYDSLAVNFGCTGGQHRSVYSAEKLADALKKEFPAIIVTVEHTELNLKN